MSLLWVYSMFMCINLSELIYILSKTLPDLGLMIVSVCGRLTTQRFVS